MTLRFSQRISTGKTSREALSVIIRLAAKAPCRRAPLSSAQTLGHQMLLRVLSSIVAMALVALHGSVAAFEGKGTDPTFTITVPALPDISLRKTAPASGSPPQLQGDDGTYKVAVIVSAASKAVSARECAGTGLRSILSRPGMPNRDSIYRAPLSASTFLVLYVITEGAQSALHAHLLAAAEGTHCVEVHFSRPQRPGEDVDDWRQTFSSARVEER